MRYRRERWPREKPVQAFVCSWARFLWLRRDFGGVEGRGKPLLLPVIACAVPKAGTADAGRFVPADNVSVGVLADHVVEEQVLGDDGVAFHAHHLGDVGDAPGAVAQTSCLDDNI